MTSRMSDLRETGSADRGDAALHAGVFAFSRPHLLGIDGLRRPEAERLRQIGQPVLLARTKDELWDSTQRARDFLPRARALELPQFGAGVFDTGAEAIATPLKEFLSA